MITHEGILRDVLGFEKRIVEARQKLDELPAGMLPYQEHKKREEQRREHQAEIAHVQQLIKYAMEGLEEWN